MKPLKSVSHAPFLLFLFLFFCQLNISQPSCSPRFLKHLHCPASCPHFIFGFTSFCTTTLFIYLNDFSVLKNNKLKQKSHLRFVSLCWKLAFLMKTTHVTCDSEVDHGTRPRWFCPWEPVSSLAQDAALSENALLLTNSNFLHSPHTAPTAFLLPLLLPHWPPVPVSVFCILL